MDLSRMPVKGSSQEQLTTDSVRTRPPMRLGKSPAGEPQRAGNTTDASADEIPRTVSAAASI